jgi:hypothetical protein
MKEFFLIGLHRHFIKWLLNNELIFMNQKSFSMISYVEKKIAKQEHFFEKYFVRYLNSIFLNTRHKGF